MVNKIDLTRPILPVAKPQALASKSSSKASGANFQEIFQGQLQKGQVQFSKHAKERMESRNIQLDENELLKLNEAVTSAAKKGARESLVLFPHTAFIVSVSNRTVVTAVDAGSMKENVFTNIDSAVIL